MMIFPPSFSKADRSGLFAAKMFENSLTDRRNSLSNCGYVSVCQFHDGFCCSHVPSQLTVMGNG